MGGHLQLRSRTGASISTRSMIVESWKTAGYSVNTSSTPITTSWTSIGSDVGQTGEINTVYVPSKNDVYRVTLNLFGANANPTQMLLVEKF